MHTRLLSIALFFLLTLLLTKPLLSQSSEGTRFWFSFMEHRDNGLNTKVAMITSRFNTSGSISVPGQNWSQSFIVSANEVTIITLPAFTEVQTSGIIENLGILLTTQAPVSLYIHQYHNFRSEATIVLPQSAIGNEYYVMSFSGANIQNTDYPSEFLMLATEDETTITYTLSDNNSGGGLAGSSFTILLNKGEAYQIQGDLATSDLTGTHIVGDKNFALFAGARWTTVPTNCEARDNLMEQMYPVATWGKQFVTVPSNGSSSDIIRILAAEDNTNITVYGNTTSSYNLNAGQFTTFNQSAASYIEADKSILIAQYLTGSACNGHELGDPSMVLLNSIEQTKDTLTLYNSRFENITESYINVIMATIDAPFVAIDGVNISNNYITTTIGLNDEFTYALLTVSSGTHTITSSGCGVIATAYGYGNLESYAYNGGAGFRNINANPIPEGGCLNDTISFDTDLPEPKYSFFWDLGDGTTTTEASFEHFYPNLGFYPLQLIINDNCLGTSDTLNRDLLISLRQAVNTQDDVLVCEGEPFQLGATDVADARYEWTGPNNFFSEEQSPLFPSSRLSLSGEYSVIGIVSGCATFPAFNTVDIKPNPAPFLGEDQVFCSKEEEILLTLMPFTTYLWQNNAATPSFNVTKEGVYSVKVTDLFGCMGIDSVFIQDVCPSNVYVPNAFSPNRDGINDEFRFYATDITSSELSIFDRWGNLLFTSTDLNAFWNGRFNGKIMPQGVYVWQLKIEGYKRDGGVLKEVLSGSVVLVR